MAAPSGPLSALESSSSSSSDEEELARCREAAMPAWGLEHRSRGPEKPKADAANNQLPASQPSLRRKADEHEQDGNELQTTPEFRAHVAKKLGALLDSSITISEVVKEPKKTEIQKVPPEDDGFRLFFTSIPGDSDKKAAPQPSRKRFPSGSRTLRRQGLHSPIRGCPGPTYSPPPECLARNSFQDLCWSPGSTLTSAPPSSAVDRASPPTHHSTKGAADQQAPPSQSIFERQRAGTGEGQRERETESRAGSTLGAVSTEADAGARTHEP
ncbi:protein CUSTOS isoform X5 [Acinonyx jubatus]|uniref:Protein CUSTOS n=1 Tax=Acinonyx jubatus TaxID=32536 RepID=A0ABM3NPY0_ACIJB|nr:protein CUSTOS isoform X5 [Acinonyx jubatus]